MRDDRATASFLSLRMTRFDASKAAEHGHRCTIKRADSRRRKIEKAEIAHPTDPQTPNTIQRSVSERSRIPTSGLVSRLLNPEQTAPYVAFCGCTVTIISERSSCCGQSGRVCRVFWRPEPWVLVRLRSGVLLALPWSWTNLPKPEVASSSGPVSALLSPSALQDLVRFLRSREERHTGSVPNVRATA